MILVVPAGFLAGTLIAALTLLAEHSRLAFNSYALFGNGALLVPALLAPFSLYPGRVWALERGGRALELALFVLGLHFGIGMISILEVLVFPVDPTLTVGDALPGFTFSGAVFVLPAALLAGAALWIGSRAHSAALSIAIVLGVLASAFLAIAFGAGLGILAGGAVALERRLPRRTAVIGVTLLIAIVVVGDLPIASALISPLPN